MSQRLGSNINSPLFMTDPVPVRNNGIQNISHNSDQSFFVKGDEIKEDTSGTYEHVGGDDDIYIINNQGNRFKFHRNPLKDTLEELKTQLNVQVRHLSIDHTELFKTIVDALRLLYSNHTMYNLVLNDIHTAFSDVKDIKPGTVAAFFIGCFNDDKFPGPLGCSPKCASSLPPIEGTSGYQNCDDIVLIYSEGLFSSLNEKRSDHAYIYIEDVDFSGFYTENIQQLREAGIENATLIFGNQDGSYREITGTLLIDQLPCKTEDNNTVGQSIKTNVQVTNDNDTNSNSAGMVFIIIIIIIIILLLIVLYRSR
jgi:hypothetical protein